jgi:DUF4097 and DUF4098 domain-containing protein YvlB
MIWRPPRSTLITTYTTLFRSEAGRDAERVPDRLRAREPVDGVRQRAGIAAVKAGEERLDHRGGVARRPAGLPHRARPAEELRETREAREAAREAAQSARERERQAAQSARERERASAQRNQTAEESERTTRVLRIGTNGDIQVSNLSGDIVVTRGSGSEASVEIVKTSRAATSDEAKAMLQSVNVDIVERSNRAEIRTRHTRTDEMRRGNRRSHVAVAFTITAPAGTRVRAESISGSITTKDITGEISLKSVSGTIRVSNAGRIAGAQTISGDVEITDTDADGPIEVSSVSGSVVLRRVEARQLEVGAISGNVVLDHVRGGRVEAQTVSGAVEFTGDLQKNARYDFNSHAGSIEVAVTGGSGFELEATSFSGSVRSDFPATAQGNAAERGRGPRERSVRAVVGDGSAVLDLTTFSGSITVTKK